MFLQVAEFHAAFGFPHADHPLLPDRKQRELRKRLLIEEVQELIMGLRADDRLNIAKELADVCYILAGTGVVYGIAPTTPFASPFDNCSQMAVFIHTPLDDIIMAYLEDYLRAEARDNLDEIWTSINFMLWAMFGLALHLAIPLNAVFAEVHRSNMTKLIDADQQLMRTDGKILKGPNYQPPSLSEIMHG